MKHIILIVEDDAFLNKGIGIKLQREGYDTVSATSLQEAHALFSQHSPDLVICDITLPDGSGLDFCGEIRRQSTVLFLFLTAMDTELDIINGYDAGADDYITKPFSLLILISKVRAMLGRLTPPSESIITSGALIVYPGEMRLLKGGEAVFLSPTEWKLLRAFLDQPRRILSRNMLLESLWDHEGQFVEGNTVAVNIRRLREKIEDDPSNPVYLRTVRGIGYIWDMECAET